MKKRNAIILTGFMRDFENNIKSFRENLEDENTDLFIATWDKRGIKKLETKFITLTDGTTRELGNWKGCDDSIVKREHIENTYGIVLKSMEILNLDLFEDSIEQYAKICEAAGAVDIHAKVKPKNYMTLMRRYCIFYMINRGWKLMESYEKENGIRYEKVCKIRADFEKGGYYPKINWKSTIPENVINIGNWNLQLYSQLDRNIPFNFQDHFAIGNREDMFHYFDVFNNLHSLVGKFEYGPKQWHAEYCMSLMLNRNGIICKPIK